MHDDVITFLFTDIEGSTRLWEQEPERMRPALARHDEIVRAAVEARRGKVVKMTGDGLHAAFGDALDAVLATLDLQQALQDPAATAGLALRIRCGLHAGPSEDRDGDYFGTVVNRAARIMSAAHGGQMLVSQAVAERLRRRLPDGVLLRDLGSIRLRDLANAERIYQLVHPALRGEFPALRSLEGVPHNLPVELSSFVGREREIGKLRELLGQHRLVTLLGMGGLGKTRLSMHVAAEALEENPDGTWLVELAALKESRWVAQAIASALGVKEEGGSIEEALVAHVKGRRILIVLDNCEHVVEGCAAIVRKLLSAGAGVRVLATSREPLHVPGEAVFPITGLPVPGPREALAGAVAQYESVRLFVDRATAALPGFTLNDDNATSIAAICHRLDGIPLAIELAAARVRSVSIPQIAARLKDRFRLLTSSDPTALPRQRTLRAMIDWSHELLPDAERKLFRDLSVFAGGWTVEAAETVCSEGAAADSVLDLLGRLVEKSLVGFDERTGRYHMLETVRQYAAEQLSATGGGGALHDRHIDFFLAMAKDARPRLAGPDQARWLGALDDELENILAAHEWAGRSPARAVAGLSMLNDLTVYWSKRGLLQLAERALTEALARPAVQAASGIRAKGLFNAGQFRYFMGRAREARECLRESLAIARALDEPRGIALVQQSLAMVAIAENDLAAAHASLQEAVDLGRRSGDRDSLASSLNSLALLHRVEGRPAESLPLYEQVARLGRELGNGEAEAIGMLNQSMVLLELGEEARARRLACEVLGRQEAKLSRPVMQSALDLCAGLAAHGQRWTLAARLFGAAERQAQESGFKRDAADRMFLEPRITRAREALQPCDYEAAVAAGQSLPCADAVSEAWDAFREALAAEAAGATQLTSR